MKKLINNRIQKLTHIIGTNLCALYLNGELIKQEIYFKPSEVIDIIEDLELNGVTIQLLELESTTLLETYLFENTIFPKKFFSISSCFDFDSIEPLVCTCDLKLKKCLDNSNCLIN